LSPESELGLSAQKSAYGWCIRCPFVYTFAGRKILKPNPGVALDTMRSRAVHFIFLLPPDFFNPKKP